MRFVDANGFPVDDDDALKKIICKPLKPRKLTNYERIKAMSIEELASLLMCPAEYDLNFNRTSDCPADMTRNCGDCVKRWLESEVAE